MQDPSVRSSPRRHVEERAEEEGRGGDSIWLGTTGSLFTGTETVQAERERWSFSNLNAPSQEPLNSSDLLSDAVRSGDRGLNYFALPDSTEGVPAASSFRIACGPKRDYVPQRNAAAIYG